MSEEAKSSPIAWKNSSSIKSQNLNSPINAIKKNSSSDNSENWNLRKKIQYNDSVDKKGGGGTGLLFGASDKSSSSSKKFNKKGSTSNNSSGIKDLHAGAQSINSSSEKSDQRHFDRMMRRNEIIDFYDFHNENTDSEFKFKQKNGLRVSEQMSEIEEVEIEGDDTNISPSSVNENKVEK
jgi:hypothetical protein